MDAIALCLLLGVAPLLPPQPGMSGWHMLRMPGAEVDELRQPFLPQRWFWDGRLRVWRARPDAFEAETAEQMACDGFTYHAAQTTEIAGR